MSRIPLIKPYMDNRIRQRVLDVLDSGYLTEGPVTAEFEAACRHYIGCEHALAVCNCTVGLEAALRCIGVGPGDEVIVPDYTYPATAAAANLIGATVVLVDVDPHSFLIDVDALEAAYTPRTKAVIPVSLFGSPLDYDAVMAWAHGRGVVVIEDAACSIGAEYKGRKVGNCADITVFSFHPRKFITTGEGGLITTNNPAWAKWLDAYKHFGMTAMSSREGAQFGMVGTNYKLSNILSAVGLGQMERIDALLARRRALARRYTELLRSVPGVGLPTNTPGGLHSFQTYCVLIPDRDRIMKSLRAADIEVQIGSYALHLHPAYAESAHCRWIGPLAGSKKAYAQALALPLYHDMTEADQDRVLHALKRAL